MQPAESDSALVDALTRLETALLSPPVAGELAAWTQTCREGLGAVAQHLPAYFQDHLKPQYLEIARSDAEQLPRVERMIADDQGLVDELEKFSRRLSAFAASAEQAKKHESKVADERAGLEQEGIALIIRIRKQRAAADTWLTEALYRDRGAVD
jgi:hypothetical protein